MIFRLLVLVVGLMGSVSAASTPAVRIAVVSDGEEKDLASLVMAELSSSPTVTLIERDDLAKIGDEATVQQLAGSDGTALCKLAGADGLIFLDRRADGPHVRFTAVNLGYALFDDPIPNGIDAAQEARAIVHLVVADAAKLKLDPAKAISISVLNIRVNAASADSATLERALTAMLESRLAWVPEYVVLERRHADTLGFERSLASPDPLLQGAYLVDGSITSPESDTGDLEVVLRMRSPKNGKQTTLNFKGTTADLPALVEEMGKGIGLAIGSATSPPQWQPAAEAREYLEEGIWGWQHHDPRAALEALDSAALLGETASDLLAIRVQVLCLLAGQEPYFYGGKDLAPEPLSLDERVGLIRRAMDDLRAYQHDREKNLQIFNTNRNIEVRTGDLHGEVLKEGLVILRLLDPASPMTNDLRQELRDLAGFDPAHGKFPEFYGTEPDDLSNSLDEELAYYRIRATTQIHWLPSVNADHFCERFLKTPEEQDAAYDRFAQSLLADPKGRLFGLLLQARGPGYKVRRNDVVMQKEGRPDNMMLAEVEQLADPFRNRFPEIASAPLPPLTGSAPTAAPLVVTQFWHPWLVPDSPAGSDFLTSYWSVCPDGLWLAGYFSVAEKAQLFHIHLPDMQTQVIDPPDKKPTQGILWTPRGLLATAREGEVNGGNGGFYNELSIYDPTTASWSKRQLAVTFLPQPFWVDGKIYVAIAAMGKSYSDRESGVAKYDWDADKLTLLADNRRRPAQNSFDDTASYRITAIFPGPGNKPAITTDSGTYYIEETSGPWANVFDSRFNDQVVRSVDQSIIFNDMGEMTLINPALPAPVPWMAASQPIWRKPKSATTSNPIPTPWANQAIWDCPPGKQKGMSAYTIAFNSDRVFLIAKLSPVRDDYELICYDKSRGRNPVHMALKFQLTDPAKVALSQVPGHMPNGWTLDELTHPLNGFQIIATPQGLCLKLMCAGFWFIPYSDIDAYLKANN